jgi:hypothetical protein
MTERNWLERNGATPAKLASVAVLAGVLGLVLWSQLAGDAPIAAKKTRQTTAPQAKSGETKPAMKTVSVEPVQTQPAKPRTWPKLKLDDIAKTDPFAMPIWYLMAKADESDGQAGSLVRSAQVLEELKKQQTKIVVITDDERVATIGDQSFRVGDTIEGFEISEITRNGIVLTETAR